MPSAPSVMSKGNLQIPKKSFQDRWKEFWYKPLIDYDGIKDWFAHVQKHGMIHPYNPKDQDSTSATQQSPLNTDHNNLDSKKPDTNPSKTKRNSRKKESKLPETTFEDELHLEEESEESLTNEYYFRSSPSFPLRNYNNRTPYDEEDDDPSNDRSSTEVYEDDSITIAESITSADINPEQVEE
jgi:hypothetical protein